MERNDQEEAEDEQHEETSAFIRETDDEQDLPSDENAVPEEFDDDSHWRVKVYYLDSEGTWMDQGTGFIACTQVSQGSMIVVQDEKDSTSCIHQSRILSSESYERQGESIIMWKEMNEETFKEFDVALSFQNPEHCVSAWHLIGRLTQQNPYQYGYHVMKCAEEIYAQRSGTPSGRSDGGSPYLPDCTIDNLEDLRNVLAASNPSYHVGYVDTLLANDAAYLQKFFLIFGELEDLEDMNSLRFIAEITRYFLLLNDSGLLETLLSEGMFVQVLGAMEYDPALRSQENYREFITSRSTLREVLPLTDELRSLVKRFFSLKFLKEIVIRPLMDEGGITAINSLMVFHARDICSAVFSDTKYLKQILTTITQAECSDNSSSSGSSSGNLDLDIPSYAALVFLSELFNLSKLVPFDKRIEMYTSMMTNIRNFFFAALHYALLQPPTVSVPSNRLRSHRALAIEILVTVTLTMPSSVRQIILEGPTPQPPPSVVVALRHQQGVFCNDAGSSDLKDPNSRCLLYVLIRLVTVNPNVEEIDLVTDILRTLLDADKIEKIDKEKFLQMFYDYYIHWMLIANYFGPAASSASSASSASTSSNTIAENGRGTPSVVPVPVWVSSEAMSSFAVATSARCICDLFSYFAVGHSYRMKYFVMRNNGIARVLAVLQSGKKQLFLGPIKFLRAVLATKDEFYYRHIAKQDLMAPVFEVLRSLKGRDNLIVSVIAEMIEHIRLENIHTLMEHIVEKHSALIEEFDNLDSFEKLVLRYEQFKDGKHNGSLVEKQSKLENVLKEIRNKSIAERDTEEDYFDSDDGSGDDGDSTTNNVYDFTSTRAGGGRSNSGQDWDLTTKRPRTPSPPRSMLLSSASSKSKCGQVPHSLASLSVYGDVDDSMTSVGKSQDKKSRVDDDSSDDLMPLPPLRPKFGGPDEDEKGFSLDSSTIRKLKPLVSHTFTGPSSAATSTTKKAIGFSKITAFSLVSSSSSSSSLDKGEDSLDA